MRELPALNKNDNRISTDKHRKTQNTCLKICYLQNAFVSMM